MPIFGKCQKKGPTPRGVGPFFRPYRLIPVGSLQQDKRQRKYRKRYT